LNEKMTQFLDRDGGFSVPLPGFLGIF